MCSFLISPMGRHSHSTTTLMAPSTLKSTDVTSLPDDTMWVLSFDGQLYLMKVAWEAIGDVEADHGAMVASVIRMRSLCIKYIVYSL
jgi:NAD kinase